MSTDHKITLDVHAFIKIATAATPYAAKSSDGIPGLACVQFLVESGHLVAVATDRYRAVAARVPCEGECPAFAVDTASLRKAIALIRPARKSQAVALSIEVMDGPEVHASFQAQVALFATTRGCGVAVPTTPVAVTPNAARIRELIADAVNSCGPKQEINPHLLEPLTRVGGTTTMSIASDPGRATGFAVGDWLAAAVMPMRPGTSPADTSWIGVAE